jgi:two-component system, cell cycle sensor histidine kinase and response regulator CckA
MNYSERVMQRLASVKDRDTFLAGLLAFAPVALAVWERDGHCMLVNDAFVALFGSEPPADYIIMEDEIAESIGILDMIRRSFKGETSHTPTFWYDPRDLTKVRVSGGRRVAISMTTFPLLDQAGAVQYVVATYRDQTEEILAREAIQAERDRFVTLFESVVDGIIVLDDHGRVLEANPAAGAILGQATSLLVGRTGREIWGEGALEDDWKELRTKGRVAGEAQIRRPDGSTREVEYDAIGPFVPGQHMFVLRDVSEKQQLEAQLQQARQLEAIGRLAGGVAHDFSNMLMVINCSTDLVLTKMPADGPYVQRLHQVRAAGQRAAALSSQLLAFGRRAVSSPGPLSLNTVIRDFEPLLRRLIGPEIQLNVVLDAKLGAVVADCSQIEQVVMNLALNARDALPAGGLLIIETRNVHLDVEYIEKHATLRPGDYVLLTVSDQGAGMSPEVRSHIFEPFFTTKGGKGTGLGLATVYGIVTQSGGHVFVYSEPAQGTSFKIYLPRAEGPGPLGVAPIKIGAPTGNETVLLVEDDERVRELVRLALETGGYRVLEASDGQRALSEAESYGSEIHLLITDVIVPKMSGPQLAASLQATRPALKVLFMSGYTDDAIVRFGLLPNEIPYIQKPFSSVALARKVRDVLDAPVPVH